MHEVTSFTKKALCTAFYKEGCAAAYDLWRRHANRHAEPSLCCPLSLLKLIVHLHTTLQHCALLRRRDGSVYKGSMFNVLTVIALVSILTPLAGLVFAWWSYGVLWG